MRTGAVNLKKLQQDLRVSKKAEQIAKEKLAQSKRAFEKLEKDFSKYREESESRMESLKTEISILQKHYDQLQNSGNDIDFAQTVLGGSDNGKPSQTADLMRIIDDYSRQAEIKSKEFEALVAKLDKKSGKLDELKKKHADSEGKNIKLRSSLDNVKAFLKLLNGNFIKTLRQQNMSLKEQINAQKDDFAREIEQLKQQAQEYFKRSLGQSKRDLASKIQIDSEKSSFA